MGNRKLDGKVAVTTGAASGIGRACVELFAKEGAKVVVLDVKEAEGQETVSRILAGGGEGTFVRADVSKGGEVAEAMAGAERAYGRIDILMNNAGIHIPFTELTEVKEEDWDRILGVNLKGVFLGCKYAIPIMKRNGGGSIINMASQLGLVGKAKYAAYCASKGGVINLTRALAAECAPHRIRVNALSPGAIETPLTKIEMKSEEEYRQHSSRHMLNRYGTTSEVAYAALYLASDESTFTTGSVLTVDGGYVSW